MRKHHVFRRGQPPVVDHTSKRQAVVPSLPQKVPVKVIFGRQAFALLLARGGVCFDPGLEHRGEARRQGHFAAVVKGGEEVDSFHTVWRLVRPRITQDAAGVFQGS